MLHKLLARDRSKVGEQPKPSIQRIDARSSKAYYTIQNIFRTSGESRFSMPMKGTQLQIRVSPEEKKRIRAAAKAAGVDMSRWVLEKIFPPLESLFQRRVANLRGGPDASYAFADIHDFLAALSGPELEIAASEKPDLPQSAFYANYLAAMIEFACYQKGVPPPSWLQDIEGLQNPHFGSELPSLRLYLLISSPLPFRKRNIFIDSSIGSRA